jgi:hypothetical protein
VRRSRPRALTELTTAQKADGNTSKLLLREAGLAHVHRCYGHFLGTQDAADLAEAWSFADIAGCPLDREQMAMHQGLADVAATLLAHRPAAQAAIASVPGLEVA